MFTTYHLNLLKKYNHLSLTDNGVSDEIFGCYVTNCESSNKKPVYVSDYDLWQGVTHHEYWIDDTNKIHEVVSISCGSLNNEVIADINVDLDYFEQNCVWY